MTKNYNYKRVIGKCKSWITKSKSK